MRAIVLMLASSGWYVPWSETQAGQVSFADA
jgi:hypothetical protein